MGITYDKHDEDYGLRIFIYPKDLTIELAGAPLYIWRSGDDTELVEEFGKWKFKNWYSLKEAATELMRKYPD